ncbi:MAG: hypothetical protein JWN96_4323 [Mycobacterium sp.]|nr:hypothetical protein [Mycobacterium sp.]
MVAGLLGRKADAFAALLEGKQSAAAADPSMAQLANIAQRLSSVPQPTAAFRSTLRDQLMATAGQTGTTVAPHVPTQAPTTHAPAAAHTPTVPTPRVSPGHGLGHGLGSGSTAGTSGLGSSFSSGLLTLGKTAPVWAKVFAGIAAVSVSATGVAVGADRALPGDLFYGVKKQVEAVQLDLASGARAKATTEFGFAQARINELNKLIQREHVVAGQPVSSATASHLHELLENWAENAGVATTSLIQQIQALGSSTSTAAMSEKLRTQLSDFTSQQFEAVGKLLGDMPTASLQSLTVSALGYLQRVDAVLGHDPSSLITKLPVSLNSVPGVSRVLPRLVLPSSIPTKGGKVVLPGPGAVNSLLPSGLLGSLAPTDIPGVTLPSLGSGGVTLPTTIPGITLPSLGSGGITLPTVIPGITLPTTLPSITLPSLGDAVPSIGSLLPPLPAGIGILPTLGSAGTGSSPNTGSDGKGAVVNPAPGAVKSAVASVGGAVASQVPAAVKSAAGAATDTVQGLTGPLGAVVGGLTSSAGPSLPLPSSLPVLPILPKLPGLH